MTDTIPDELKRADRWLVWREEERNGRSTKVPYCARGGAASSTDASTWSSFAVALDCSERSVGSKRPLGGLGFALGGGFAGLEIDDCIDNDAGGVLHPLAADYLHRLDSYAEISPSGTGVHILVMHDGSVTGGKKMSNPPVPITDVGVYCEGRYFTVTGAWIDGTPGTINDRTTVLRAILAELGARQPDEHGHLTEEEIIWLLNGIDAGHGRDTACLRLSGRWLALGMSEAEVTLLAVAWNRAYNRPPQDEARIVDMVHRLAIKDQGPDERRWPYRQVNRPGRRRV